MSEDDVVSLITESTRHIGLVQGEVVLRPNRPLSASGPWHFVADVKELPEGLDGEWFASKEKDETPPRLDGVRAEYVLVPFATPSAEVRIEFDLLGQDRRLLVDAVIVEETTGARFTSTAVPACEASVEIASAYTDRNQDCYLLISSRSGLLPRALRGPAHVRLTAYDLAGNPSDTVTVSITGFE